MLILSKFMNKMKFAAARKDSRSHDMINVCIQPKAVMELNLAWTCIWIR